MRAFASPWHAAAGIGDQITSVADFASLVSVFSGQSLVFRGEPKIYDTPLVPSVFREPWNESEELRQREFIEIEAARTEYREKGVSDRYLNAFAPTMHRDDLNWMFLARHFGRDTRLLDVSRNPLVALHFACADENAHDGVIYLFPPGNFRPVRGEYTDWLDRRDFPTLPISYRELLSDDFDRGGESVPYLVDPHVPQERIQARAGMFLLWKNPELVLSTERQLVPAIIGCEYKSKILSQLYAFGISQVTMFPN